MQNCLSDTQVQDAQPQSSPYELPDGGGLYLRVLPSGQKCWWYRYFFDREEKDMPFGQYPAVSLSRARERCASAWKVRETGGDPATLLT
ncbi:MAG: Arm DNA-binding domain-containing protein [Bacteroidales bacterium]|nr:Arm DNA-binding domain-containing protein [Bacteroidales bacterium]